MSSELEKKIQTTLNTIFDEKIASLKVDLAGALLAECSPVVESARAQPEPAASAQGPNAPATRLATCARRLRAQDSVRSVAAALVDCAAEFCGRAVLFIVKGDRLLGFRAAGAGAMQDRLAKISIPLSEAASMALAVEEREWVEAQAGSANLSPSVVELFELDESDRVRLLPVLLRDKVLAVLMVDSCGGTLPLEVAPIEVLVCLAEASIEAVAGRKKSVAGPVAATA